MHLKSLMQGCNAKKRGKHAVKYSPGFYQMSQGSVWWVCKTFPCFLWNPVQHTGTRAELLSKHLEFIHSQSGFRGCWVGEAGGAWEKEGNKRVRGRQWERNTRESATFFLLKPIKYGPGLLKTRGLPEYWLWPGLGRLCSLLNCTLHCPAKAAHMVLTHKQSC